MALDPDVTLGGEDLTEPILPVRGWSRGEERVHPVTALLGLLAVVVGVTALTFQDWTLDGAVWVVAGLYLAAVVVAVGARHRPRLVIGVAATLAVLAGVSVSGLAGREPDLVVFGTALASAAVLGGLVQGVRAFRGSAGRGGLPAAVVLVLLGGSGIVTPLQLVYVLWLVAAGTLLVLGIDALGVGLLGTGAYAPDASGRARRWLADRSGSMFDRAAIVAKLSFEGEDTRTRTIRFLMLMAFASVLAALGIIVDSTAVVIGAMLVAPLMTPLMAAAVSLTMGWPRRSARALAVALMGVLLAIAVGAVVAAIIPVPLSLEANPQVLSRTSPSLIDLAVAIAAGAAGAYGTARTDVADALPGVAIAISLVPPLTVVGILLQTGDLLGAVGALLLFVTNATAIVVVGGLTFIATGIVPPHRLDGRRLGTWAAVLLAPVIAGLLVSGQRIIDSGARLTVADSVVSAWLEAEGESIEGLRLDAVTVTGQLVRVEVTGPLSPLPDVDALTEQVQVALGDEVAVTLELTPRVLLTGE